MTVKRLRFIGHETKNSGQEEPEKWKDLEQERVSLMDYPWGFHTARLSRGDAGRLQKAGIIAHREIGSQGKVGFQEIIGPHPKRKHYINHKGNG
jgi:hypothetical protein